MTTREQIAAMAMQAILIRGDIGYEQIVMKAIHVTDILIDKLKETSSNKYLDTRYD